MLAYDMCDSLDSSDHKPVGMACTVEVNPKVRRPDRSGTSKHEIKMSAREYMSALKRVPSTKITGEGTHNQLQLKTTIRESPSLLLHDPE